MTDATDAMSRRRLREVLRALPQPSLLLLLAVCAVVGITAGISLLIGYGDVTIYMALVALYIAMGAFDGTLRADLTVAFLYIAGVGLFVAVPLLAATVSEPLGAVLVVVAVGACGIIPALGSRYASVRLGIGLITIYAFGHQTTSGASAAHVILGSFVALAIILAIRLIAAIPDPNGPLRSAVARVLVDHSRAALESAAMSWLRGPSRTWAGQVLIGAAQYRGASWAITQRLHEATGDRALRLEAFGDSLAEVAGDLAQGVRAPHPEPALTTAALERINLLEAERGALQAEDQDVARIAVDGLRTVSNSSLSRDRTVVGAATSMRRAATRESLRAALSLDSDYFRSALRAMVVVGISLALIALVDQPNYALPLLMGAYGVLQPTLAGSITEARRRTAGVIVGAAVSTAVIATASPAFAEVLAGVVLIVAFAFITSSIAIFMGGLVITLSIAIAPVIHVDPAQYAIRYALAVIVGAALATVAGFVTVPRSTPQRRRRALLKAMHATAAAMDDPGAETHEHRARILAAFRSQQNTVFTTHSKADPAAEASAALGGLNLLGLAIVLGFAERTSSVDATLAAIRTALLHDAASPLDQHVAHGDGSAADGVVQLLQADYHRLHTALKGIGVSDCESPLDQREWG